MPRRGYSEYDWSLSVLEIKEDMELTKLLAKTKQNKQTRLGTRNESSTSLQFLERHKFHVHCEISTISPLQSGLNFD